MRKVLAIAGITAAFLAVSAAPAAAAAPDEPPAGCWGELTRDAVPLGEHASSFAGEPRVGLPNVVDGGLSGLCEFLGQF